MPDRCSAATEYERVTDDLLRAHPACEVRCGDDECDAPYESLLDLVCDEMEERP
jgi:hypothetical protein